MKNQVVKQMSYLQLLNNGLLKKRVHLASQQLEQCRCCGWQCRVNRAKGETGVCKTGPTARVSSYGAHMGEENPLRGWYGSGTIFFSRCNLRCQYCQNADISQSDVGAEITPEELANIFLELQNRGCHNINFVSPTHVVPMLIHAIYLAAKKGLHIPLVYNTGGYDSLTCLALLDGIIDIYMPDMKYAHPTTARKYSKIPNYPKVNQLAVAEMHRQVGDLQIGQDGIAIRGLLIRHLVLPNGLAGSRQVMEFIAERISKNTYINIMDQYKPAYQSGQFPRINRRLRMDEFSEAVQIASESGLHRIDHLTENESGL